MESLVGESLLRALADRADSPAWILVWRAFAFLGSPDFFSIALPVVFAFAPARWALRLGTAFAASAALSESLKAEFGRERPDPAHFGLAGPLEDAGAFENDAFPSAHALMGMTLWGWIAWKAARPWLRAVSIALLIGIAFSRLALLRHDLLDVGAGLGIGASLLVLLASFDRRYVRPLGDLPPVESSMLWLLAGLGIALVIDLPVATMTLGVGSGLGLGTVVASARGVRSSPPGLARGALRVGLSVTGVLVARTIAGPESGWPLPALFALYAAAAAWIAGVVPSLTGGVWKRSA